MFTPEFVINSTLKIGAVYKMTAPELIETKVPHYFVVVAINDSDNYLLMSTTKWEARCKYITKQNWSLDTLRRIEPTEENGLTKDSFFDCNDYYTVTKKQLIHKAGCKHLNPRGEFNKEEYDLLVQSIRLSEVNDIPKFFLKFPKSS